MPRTARIDIPGLLQHVIVRGIERRDIFFDDNDRRLFLERLSKLLAETGTECLAWALMSNHFHLLLCPRVTKLSVFMRRLLTGYAIVFNLQHKRSGHLFQNRYKSIACQEDAYLLELIRYIHLNPLRVGLAKTIDELDSYPWSGHAVLMGKQKLSGQSIDDVLLLFGQKKKVARQAYREFVIDGIKQGKRDDLVGGGLRRSQGARSMGEYEAYDERILGSGEFVESLWREAESSEIHGSNISLDEMMQRAADTLQVKVELLRQKNRTKELAAVRAAICYLAVRMCNFSGVAVARSLNMTRSGVSVAVKRGGEIISGNPTLRGKLID
ncbi:MAG: transposase [Betaproteobacteria bacterium]|nr:transposase [Betaproteobacteria bacterium]